MTRDPEPFLCLKCGKRFVNAIHDDEHDTILAVRAPEFLKAKYQPTPRPKKVVEPGPRSEWAGMCFIGWHYKCPGMNYEKFTHCQCPCHTDTPPVDAWWNKGRKRG